MKIKQTHESTSGSVVAEHPNVARVFCTADGGYVTAWSLAKFGTTIARRDSETVVEVSNAIMAEAREAHAALRMLD